MSKLVSRSDDKPGNSSSNQLLREIEALSRALYLQKTPPSIILPNLRNPDQKPKNKTTEEATKNIVRSSSLWNWKKTLEALSHIRDRKFSCSFFLHVHSIEGLPPIFNDSNLQVHFKRKKELLTTRPSSVSNGISDFDETLINSCSVYCRKSGPLNSCIYEPKTFLVYVSVVGASGFDIGKHWVDLTRLLPLTIEELVGDKSTGRWATSFKLSGKAEGAILNVSFGFSVTTDSVHVARFRSSAKSRGSGSVPLSRYLNLRTSSVNPALELSKSVRFLYQKLDEGSSVGLSVMKSSDLVDAMIEEEKDDDMEFTVIDRGIELELPRMEETEATDVVDDMSDLSRPEETSDLLRPEETSDLSRLEETSYLSRPEETSDLSRLEETSDLSRPEETKVAEVDNSSKSVASEFLNIVGNESEDEAESPRERLLREFEAEATVSGDFIFGLDLDRTESEDDDVSEDYTTISSIFESGGEEDEMFVRSIQYRRKAQVLEELETEALMRQWGFDESAFRVPPRCPLSSGFGSPIEVASENHSDE